jgi:hypothetical protein
VSDFFPHRLSCYCGCERESDGWKKQCLNFFSSHTTQPPYTVIIMRRRRRPSYDKYIHTFFCATLGIFLLMLALFLNAGRKGHSPFFFSPSFFLSVYSGKSMHEKLEMFTRANLDKLRPRSQSKNLRGV